MTDVLLCYLAALAICAGAFWSLLLLMKRGLHGRLRLGGFFGGMLFAIAFFLVMMLLFQGTFRTEQYYNTVIFRGVVGFVYLVLLCFARFLLVRLAFFGREREEQGSSFCMGFGCAPGAFLAAYLLIMGLVLAWNGLFNGPAIVEDNGLLGFADNTMISVFRPAAGHISFAFLFAFFALMGLSSGWFLQKITSRDYPTGVTVGWLVLLLVLESAAILPVPFIQMFQLTHWQPALIAGLCAAAHFVLVRFMPGEQKTVNYTKQFE